MLRLYGEVLLNEIHSKASKIAEFRKTVSGWAYVVPKRYYIFYFEQEKVIKFMYEFKTTGVVFTCYKHYLNTDEEIILNNVEFILMCNFFGFERNE